MSRKIISIGLVALLAGCANQPMTVPEADSDAAQLFEARCTGCHALPHPARNRADEWPGILALMDRRMRERHVQPLDDDERQELLRYLQAHARQ